MSNYYYIQSALKGGNVIDVRGDDDSGPGPLLYAYTKDTSDADHQLWEFIADPDGSGYYFIKSKLNGYVIAVQQNADVQAGRWDGTPLDVEPQQTGVAAYHQLWQFVEHPSGSGYCFIMSRVPGNVIDIQRASSKSGTPLDSWPLKLSGIDNQLWRVVDGSFPSTVSTVRSGSLGSNSNYFLYGDPDCTPLLGAGVVINITQDIVCESVAPPTAAGCPNQGTPYFGFAFQMNCYSPSGDTDFWAYQQYVVMLWKNSSGGFDVHYQVDNWVLNLQNSFNTTPIMASLPDAVLPAGYQIIITTTTTGTPPGGIGWADFQIFDNNGNKLGGASVTVPNPTPITAFELDVVGPVDSESATLSSGAGSITYVLPGGPLLRAFQPTTAQPNPPCIAGTGGTCETANTIYGFLPSNSNGIFTQSFEVDTTKPMIVRRGPMRPSTFVP